MRGREGGRENKQGEKKNGGMGLRRGANLHGEGTGGIGRDGGGQVDEDGERQCADGEKKEWE